MIAGARDTWDFWVNEGRSSWGGNWNWEARRRRPERARRSCCWQLQLEMEESCLNGDAGATVHVGVHDAGAALKSQASEEQLNSATLWPAQVRSWNRGKRHEHSGMATVGIQAVLVGDRNTREGFYATCERRPRGSRIKHVDARVQPVRSIRRAEHTIRELCAWVSGRQKCSQEGNLVALRRHRCLSTKKHDNGSFGTDGSTLDSQFDNDVMDGDGACTFVDGRSGPVEKQQDGFSDVFPSASKEKPCMATGPTRSGRRGQVDRSHVAFGRPCRGTWRVAIWASAACESTYSGRHSQLESASKKIGSLREEGPHLQSSLRTLSENRPSGDERINHTRSGAYTPRARCFEKGSQSHRSSSVGRWMKVFQNIETLPVLLMNFFRAASKSGIGFSLRTKITRASCRRRTGTVVPKAETFCDLITAYHKVLSEGCESRNNHRYALMVQDLATPWIQSHTCKTKSSHETQQSMQKFLEPTKKPEETYTDNSWEFGKSCEELPSRRKWLQKCAVQIFFFRISKNRNIHNLMRTYFFELSKAVMVKNP